MNRDISHLFAPLLAVALLGVVVWHTVAALRESGALGGGTRRTGVSSADPYAALDRQLADARPQALDRPMRDPFGGPTVSPAPVAVEPARPTGPRPAPRPAPPPVPVLTAVVFDSDPRAIVRWDGRDWTVRQGVLFDVFQVVSISRDQVVLKRGDESIVLQRPQGERTP